MGDRVVPVPQVPPQMVPPPPVQEPPQTVPPAAESTASPAPAEAAPERTAPPEAAPPPRVERDAAPARPPASAEATEDAVTGGPRKSRALLLPLLGVAVIAVVLGTVTVGKLRSRAPTVPSEVPPVQTETAAETDPPTETAPPTETNWTSMYEEQYASIVRARPYPLADGARLKGIEDVIMLQDAMDRLLGTEDGEAAIEGEEEDYRSIELETRETLLLCDREAAGTVDGTFKNADLAITLEDVSYTLTYGYDARTRGTQYTVSDADGEAVGAAYAEAIDAGRYLLVLCLHPGRYVVAYVCEEDALYPVGYVLR